MSTTSELSAPVAARLGPGSADSYRLLVDAVTDYAIFHLDPDGVIASWNAGAERIKGYRAAEIVGRHFSVLYSPEDATAGEPQRMLQRALADGHCEEERQRVRKDGTPFWALVTVTALFDESNRHIGFAEMTRDITELRRNERALRKQAEATLHTYEARYHTLFEYAQVGVLLADDESVYLDANESACRMLGYSRGEIIGMHASDIVARAETPQISSALSEIHSRIDHHREWQFRRKDGSVFPADVVATKMPDGTVMGMIRDISDRKLADEYREHLTAVVESSGDAVVSKDLNGVVTSWNASAEAIFGYTAAEMIGTPVSLLIPDDRREEEILILDRLRRGERVEALETVRQTKDGRLIDVSITISPIRDSDGRIIGASKIAREITALKERGREITRLSRLYAALSQINQAIVWTPSRDELFRKICRVLVDRGGFRMAWIGWHMPETHRLVPVAEWGDENGYLQSVEVYADDRPEGQGPSGRAFRTGRPYVSNDVLGDPATAPWRPELDRRGFRASAAFPIRSMGEVCGTLSVYADTREFFHDKEIALLEEAATDVSFALDNFAREDARRLAEETLRSEMRFSDTMIESMPGVVYFYDVDGRFLRWNRNFESVSGYSGEEIARMHPRDFYADEDKPRLEQRIAEVFAKGESSIEAPFVSKDGTATPYFFTGRHVMFDGKSCLVGVGIDITDRMRMEAEREKRHRAEASDRIKSTFLATMSHELRTPLNSILGFTGIVLRGLAGPLTAEQTKQLGMVRGSARHLLDLINDVLDISKIEAGQFEVRSEAFGLPAAIERVAASVKPLADEKSLSVTTNVAPELGEMVSDQRRVEQILLNLLNNAIKFTERGGAILTAEFVAAHQPSLDARPFAAVRLCVADTGPGIKPADLESLFQPFRQLDTGLSRQHEGTGLGLAICCRLAELLGGEISASSEWQRGSEFTVILPIQRTNGSEP
jgi:PAS domain S-box-containing protein